MLKRHPTFAGGLLLALYLLMPCPAKAQVLGEVPSPFSSIRENSVSTMAALGDSLWIGPGLNRNIANTTDWFLPVGADSVANGRGRAFSISLAPDTVFAGLGFNLETINGNVPTGLGYHYSVDGGDSWDYIPHPLEREEDTLFVYGGQSYASLPITVPEQSPPYDMAMKGDTLLSANWASGILRSRDFGQSWERLILPPQPATQLVPEETYQFTSNGDDNRYDPRFDQNLLGFSVLIDSQRRVWAGTAAGINISANALQEERDSIRWEHDQMVNSETGLLANWVIAIGEQPSTGTVWMTNWPAGLRENERYGVVSTSDGGQTYEQHLIGEQVNDIGFAGGYVFAAANSGLFISPDNGTSWTHISQIRTPNTYIKEGARYLSIATTSNRLWVSTTDGIASTADLGNSWQITRVNFPLSGGNQYRQDVATVDSYAYPNPFSQRRHGIVRIKFEIEQQGRVTITLYDFGMNRIRELENRTFSAGTYEAVWNGTDENGRRVANGPVLYQIETPSGTFRGKILVID